MEPLINFPSSTIRFIDFPTDVHTYIFSLCSVWDVIQLRPVCKYIRTIIEKPSVFKYTTFHIDGTAEPEPNRLSSLQHGIIDNFVSLPAFVDAIQYDHIQQLSTAYPNLRTIIFNTREKYISPNVWNYITQLSTIQQLSINQLCIEHIQYWNQCDPLVTLQHLQVKLGPLPPPHLVPAMTSLHYNRTGIQNATLISQYTTLTSLSLFFIAWPDTVLIEMLKSLPNLTILHLPRSDSITDDVLYTISQSKITDLNILFCDNWTVDGFNWCATVPFTRLDITGFTGDAEQWGRMMEILVKMDTLTYLAILSIPHVTINDVKQLSLFPSIEIIQFDLILLLEPSISSHLSSNSKLSSMISTIDTSTHTDSWTPYHTAELFPYCRSLTSLSFDFAHCNSTLYHLLINCPPPLQRLRLHCEWNEQQLSSLLECFSQLVYLRISDGTVDVQYDNEWRVKQFKHRLRKQSCIP